MAPSGYIGLFDGATKVGTYALDSTGKVVAGILLADGAHNLTASYTSDGVYASAISPALNEQINPKQLIPVAVSMTPDANPGTDGVSVNLTIVVTPQ